MDWLDELAGECGAPEPPSLDSERIRNVLSRALLEPASLSPAEVRELAASVLTHIVRSRQP